MAGKAWCKLLLWKRWRRSSGVETTEKRSRCHREIMSSNPADPTAIRSQEQKGSKFLLWSPGGRGLLCLFPVNNHVSSCMQKGAESAFKKRVQKNMLVGCTCLMSSMRSLLLSPAARKGKTEKQWRLDLNYSSLKNILSIDKSEWRIQQARWCKS